MSALFVKGVVGAMLLLVLSPRVYATTTASHDAYARVDDQTDTLVIGTAAVEEKIQLVHGSYLLKSFQNRITHREYIPDGFIFDEFRVTVNGKTITGASGEWAWIGGDAKVLAQGEIEATVRLEGKLLGVEKHYVVYPHTGIIRQWVVSPRQVSTLVTYTCGHGTTDLFADFVGYISRLSGSLMRITKWV